MPVRFLTVLLLGATAALAQDSAGIDYFEERVRPLLAQNCYACHGADTPQPQGGLRVDSRAALLDGGNSGPAIEPGRPERSLLVRVLSHDDAIKMPPSGKLEDDQLAAVTEWIRMGAPAPGSDAEPVSETTKSNHWAFQPIARPEAPTVDGDWAQSDIDRFVVAGLREEGLQPSLPADKRTLIRRAYFDLIGVPPSAEEVDAFNADASRDAFARVIDRLLDSEHFGERWARFWLDVARYSDEGFQAKPFPSAWTYRDWVIDAFNEDMPYDQFVTRQLAADLLDDDKRHLAGLGMLTVGINLPRPTDVPENLDDRIDVVSRGLMGLSVACARCHDHKFDPIPQKDYYSLYSVFLNSPDVISPVAVEALPDSPQAAYYTEKMQYRREWIDRFRSEMLEEHKAELREPDALARYLTAAWAGRNASDTQLEELSKKANLNLWVLKRWRAFLVESLDAADGKFKEIADADGADDAIKDFADNLAAANREEPWADPNKERFRQLLRAEGAPTEILFKDAWWIETEGDSNTIKALKWQFNNVLADWGYRGGPRYAMTVREAEDPLQAHVFVRGNQYSLGAKVAPRSLTVLGATEFHQGSGRLELARAITNPENPLTARVMVNRVWQHLFGEGIVRTPSDFGLRGDHPTHPQLLDYLATRFVERGWSVKTLIREIMLSSVYQQASLDRAEAASADPENRLLWRQNRRRMDFEALRDSMLSTAGALESSIGGGPFLLDAKPSPTRRSIYAYISREEPSGTMRSFDFANPEQHTPKRQLTTVPQQALFLMNNDFVGEQARRLAGQLASVGNEDRVNELYRLVLARDPDADELDLALEYVAADETLEASKTAPTPWRYGSARLDEDNGRVEDFRPFRVWVTERWQHASMLPAPQGGRASLSAGGGAPGDDEKSAAVRRWISPIDGRIKIAGQLDHPMGAAARRFNYSNGVRGWLVSDRKGILASWDVRGFKVEAGIEGLTVEQGEILDFVVDANGDYESDNFRWAPSITQMLSREQTEQGMEPLVWSAADDFTGPQTEPLTAWERLAQVLLMTNEFAFVD